MCVAFVHAYCYVFTLLNAQKLNELQLHLSTMHVRCDEAEDQLNMMEGSSKSILERAGFLRDQRQEAFYSETG